jgi:hypothetical protein
MNDGFIKTQWKLLCEQLRGCAEAASQDPHEREEYFSQLQQFVSQEVPDCYQALLERTATASHLAVAWRGEHEANFARLEKMIDESEEESFPASDPPSTSHSHA